MLYKFKKLILVVINKIHKILFPKSNSLLNENIPVDTKNPYVAARYEWNFMYGDIIKAKYNWQQTTFLLAIANIILISALIVISFQSRFIPYAVKVDSLGNVNFAGYLNKQNEISPLMINAMLRRYIAAARSVISDPVAQKHQLDFVYSITQSNARTFLDTFYRNQNPFDIVKSETIDVTINTVLPRSSKTWQIEWTETHHNSNGHITSQNRFEGLATIAHHLPVSKDEINVNPIGLYITNLSWADQQ